MLIEFVGGHGFHQWFARRVCAVVCVSFICMAYMLVCVILCVCYIYGERAAYVCLCVCVLRWFAWLSLMSFSALTWQVLYLVMCAWYVSVCARECVKCASAKREPGTTLLPVTHLLEQLYHSRTLIPN